MTQVTETEGRLRAQLVRHRWLVAVLLTVVAAVPRFYDLGSDSLWGDEDLTALAARSVARGDGPSLPSGMPYLRAIPFTWANAAVVRVLNEEEDELPYRFTSALFGSLTPAALFLSGSTFVSPPAALVAGTFLSVSRWHIDTSRHARMYAPFVFFFILAATFLWRWGSGGGRRDLVLGMAFFGVAGWLHLLGLMAIEFAVVPLALRSARRPPEWIVLSLAIGLAALLYLSTEFFVGAGYRDFNLPADFVLDGMVPRVTEQATTNYPWLGLGGVLGLVLGLRDLGTLPSEASTRGAISRLAVLAGWVLMAAFAVGGHLWGVAQAGLVLVLVHPDRTLGVARRNIVPLLSVAIVGLVWTALRVSSLGLQEGIVALVDYPFPYAAILFPLMPGVLLLCCIAIPWVALSPDRDARAGLIGCLVCSILPLAALGLVQEWGPTRYLIHVYPFLLLSASAVLVFLGETAARRLATNPAMLAGALGVAVAFSGATGGHGLVQAAQAAGMVGDRNTRPDHRGPGRFLAETLRAGDIVITEHPETTMFYTGQVDYWFRRAGDARPYLYLDSAGVVRDDYAAGRLAPTVAAIEDAVRSAPDRAWLVTSGETFPERGWYLTPEQGDWLDSVEANVTPSFVGLDGVSAVYCLNCPE